MSLYTYQNMAGHRFGLPERALEPRDCWGGEPADPCEEEYDRWEEEESGRAYRRETAPHY